MRPAGDYSAFYRDITRGLGKMPKGAELLRTADETLTLLMYILYPVLLVLIFAVCCLQELTLRETAGAVMPFILVPGTGFLLLTFARKRLNRRRPFEVWDMDPLIPRDKTGCSMPSRHVFSSAVISMCVLRLSVPVGIILLVMTAVSAAVRVLGGIHYPSDVAVGLVVGVIAGSFLMIF